MKLQICIYFHQTNLNQNESLAKMRMKWNHNGGTVLYFTHSFTNEKYEANNGNNTWINKLLTPTVKELSTPQANTFPFVNWAHIPIQIILLTRTYFNCNSCLW